MFDKLICAISTICLAVVLVLVLVLKDSLRTYFKSLSLFWSLGVRSLSLGGQVQEVLVLVLGGQVLVLVLGGQVLVGQVLVNIPGCMRRMNCTHADRSDGRPVRLYFRSWRRAWRRNLCRTTKNDSIG